jgi:prefoldin subunit 5
LTLDTSFNQNSNGLSDNEEEKNEDAIEHLKKQIEALNAQLHTIEKEDAKIINELSDKIDNLAKMNIVSKQKELAFD